MAKALLTWRDPGPSSPSEGGGGTEPVAWEAGGGEVAAWSPVAGGEAEAAGRDPKNPLFNPAAGAGRVGVVTVSTAAVAAATGAAPPLRAGLSCWVDSPGPAAWSAAKT
jgi:hypothetical protein